MLQTINNLYEKSYQAVKAQIGLAKVKNNELFDEVIKMKYNIKNENYEEDFKNLNDKINKYYEDLIKTNENE